MNIIIGLICGTLFKVEKNSKYKYLWYSLTIIGAVLLGVAAKTVIECQLYSIPYIVKIPKSFVAFIVDTVVMLIGLVIAPRITKKEV